MRIYTDIYDRYIRAELDKKDNFKQGSLRTSSLGLENEGVFAIVGSMESDPVNTTIHSFLFNKDRFDMDQAKKWLVDNKGDYYDEESIDTVRLEGKDKMSSNVGIGHSHPQKTLEIIDTEEKVGIGTGGHDFNISLLFNGGEVRVRDELNLLKNERGNNNMSLQKDSDKVGNFVRWGDSGKKYYYDPEKEDSMTKAEDKAKNRGKAIEAGEHTTKSLNLNDMNLNRTIFLFDQFYQDSSEKLVKELLELDAEATDDINILINSFGGYTNALTAILDTMASLKSNVNTICLGEADSCGAVLLASGNSRFIGEKSRTMIHEVGTGAWGKISEIEKTLEDAKEVNRILVDVLSEKSDQDNEILANIMKEDTFLSASESVDFGLVDNILEGEDEFLKENITENMKVNASSFDTFIFNKIKDKAKDSLALKQGKTNSEGEKEMPGKKEEITAKQETTVETPEVITNAVATEPEVVTEKEVKTPESKTDSADLFNLLKELSKNPDNLIAYLDEQEKTNKANTAKLAEFQEKEQKRRKEELVAFTAELKAENKILPSEMDLVQPILDSLDDSSQVEYSYSRFGVKETDTPLNIFKKFLNNLPNRGLFGQVSEVSDEFDYDKAVEHFSQKLFNKSYQETDSKEHMAIIDAMKKDVKASKLL